MWGKDGDNDHGKYTYLLNQIAHQEMIDRSSISGGTVSCDRPLMGLLTSEDDSLNADRYYAEVGAAILEPVSSSTITPPSSITPKNSETA